MKVNRAAGLALALTLALLVLGADAGATAIRRQVSLIVLALLLVDRW